MKQFCISFFTTFNGKHFGGGVDSVTIKLFSSFLKIIFLEFLRIYQIEQTIFNNFW